MFQARGNPFTHPPFAWTLEHQRPQTIFFAALSLGYIGLAAWIAAALAGGNPRRAVLLGWLAALPTVIVVIAVVVDVTGLRGTIMGYPLDPMAPLEVPDTY